MDLTQKPSRKKAANRILFNTLIVYAQKISTALISLVTTPLLLNVLGVEDFGVYNLTIGFVGMLTFFSWSLSSSTQRFIAVTIGSKNFDKLKYVLSSSLVIHISYGLLIIVVIQCVNFFYINDILDIPINRTKSIHLILTYVAGISFFSIISIPFIGTLRATEDFRTIGIVGVSESILKLIMACLLLILPGDSLILFSGLMFLVSVVSFLAYFSRVIVVKNSVYNGFALPDIALVKEMLSFVSWSVFGALAVMSRNQGVNVIINIFFGVIANAAFGISQQINNALNILAQGVTTSMSPVLMKAAGEKNNEKMLYVMRSMAKFSFFSISIISIPAFFEMPNILGFWLKVIPEGSVIFSRLTIILVLVVLLSSGMQNVFIAIGKVKVYNIYVSMFLILNLPISFFLLKSGFASYTVILVGIVLEIITICIRLILLKKFLDYKISSYFNELVEIVLPTLVVSGLLFLIKDLEVSKFSHMVMSFTISILISPFVIYRFSLDSFQKDYLLNIFHKLKIKGNGRD
jgi:O-antigen/teichoic acid export membrane protein